MQSMEEHFLPKGAASPWQLKRTSTRAKYLTSYHDKISTLSGVIFLIVQQHLMKSGFGSLMPSVHSQKRFYRSDIT